MAENVYPYTLFRSDRRTISIQIREGEVIVRAPKRLAKRRSTGLSPRIPRGSRATLPSRRSPCRCRSEIRCRSGAGKCALHRIPREARPHIGSPRDFWQAIRCPSHWIRPLLPPPCANGTRRRRKGRLCRYVGRLRKNTALRTD